MALSKISELWGISKAIAYPLVTDSEDSFSVGAGIVIPGIKSVKFADEIEIQKCTGDNKTLAIHSDILETSFSLEFAKIDLDLKALLTGGRVVSSGTTPNQKNVYSMQDGDKPNYFQLAFQIDGVDLGLGCFNFYIMKCMVSNAPIAGQERGFSTFSHDGTGVMTTHKFTRGNKTAGLFYDIEECETLIELAAVEDEGST